MLQILTYDVPPLVSALRSGYFRRAGLRVVTASDSRELLERAAILRPNVVIVVAGLLDPVDQGGLARQLRSHLAEGRSLLLLALPQERSNVEEDLRPYDGILSLEEPELDLARLMGTMTVQAKRQQPRERVVMATRLWAEADEAIEGVTVDFSGAGAGLRLPRAPAADPYTLRISRRDGRSVTMGARVVWMDDYSEHYVRMGVRFIGATLDSVRALYDLAFWEEHEDVGERVLVLRGEISEKTTFAALLRRLTSVVALDLSEVRRVNSAGVLRWIEFLRRIPAGADVRLRRLSIPLARQMLLVPAMVRRCTIESYYVPYECEECDVDTSVLIFRDRSLFAPVCLDCGQEMTLSEPLLGLGDSPADPKTRH